MYKIRKTRRITWLAVGGGIAVGLIIGVFAAGLWPQTLLHAMATDRAETYAMATGPVDDDVEAVYLLDFLTGDLRALVIGKQVGGFQGVYTFNVANHLGIDPSKNPRYMMVTGYANIRRGGSRMQLSRAVVYIAEVSSGKVGAYAVPWNPSMAAAGQKMGGNLIPVALDQFRLPPAGPGDCYYHAISIIRYIQMEITVNGLARQAMDGITIAKLLEELNLRDKPVAVEVNLQLIPKLHHADHRLANGDRLEIVTLVGGG